MSEKQNLTNFGFDPDAISPVQEAVLPQTRGGLPFGTGQVFSRDLNNWGPRAGATFKVDDRTVVRGGYGLTYLPSITDRGTRFGFSVVTPVLSSSDGDRTPYATLTNPFPTGILAPPVRPRDWRRRRTEHRRQPPRLRDPGVSPVLGRSSAGAAVASVVEASLVRSRTNKLGISRPVNDLTEAQLGLGDATLNAVVANPFAGLMPDAPNRNGATVQQRELQRPYPHFGTINEQLVPIGYLRYTALQASWEKRLTRGVHMLASYTWSKTEQATSVLNMGQGVYEEPTATHRPHVLRLSGGWNAPPLNSRPALVKHLLGGWQINTVTTLRSGTVANMVGGGGTAGVGIKLIGDPGLENPTKARWFNTCTLTVAGARQGCASDSETLPAGSLAAAGDRILQPASTVACPTGVGSRASAPNAGNRS